MFGLTSSLAALLLSATTGGVGLPFGVPPTPEDPVLARALPEQCLFCLGWAGAASPDPKSSNQTEQLLAEPEVQSFLTLIDRYARHAVQGGLAAPDKDDVTALTSSKVLCAFVTHPGVAFVSRLKSTGRPDFTEIEGGIVFSLGEDAAIVRDGAKQWATTLQNMLVSAHHPPESGEGQSGKTGDGKTRDKPKSKETPAREVNDPIETVKIGGQDWYRLPSTTIDRPRIVFGFHDKYFIVGIGNHAVEDILARMQGGDTPRWWTAIGQQLPVQRRSVVVYADLHSLSDLGVSWLDPKQRPKARAMLEMLGLSNATALVEAWGLDGDDFVNKTLLALDGPPRGLLQLVSDRPLKAEDLAAIPRDAAVAAAFRLDPQKALDVVLASLEKLDPKTRADAIGKIDELERSLGIDLRHGTLKALGDTWCVYASPSEGNLLFSGLTAVVPLRDWAGMNLSYGRAMALAKRWAPSRRPRPDNDEDRQPSVEIEQFSFAGHEVFYLALPAGLGFAPACCMTKTEMVLALSPLNVKSYLSRDGRHEPLDRLPKVAGLFADGDGPTFAAYGDAQSAFELLAGLTAVNAVALAQMFPGEDHAAVVAALPSPLAIHRHLGPTLATLRRTKHGVEFVSRGTIPLPSAACWLGVIAWETWLMDGASIATGPTITAPPQPVQAGGAVGPDAVYPSTGSPSPTPETKPPATAPLKPVEKKAAATAKPSPAGEKKSSYAPKP